MVTSIAEAIPLIQVLKEHNGIQDALKPMTVPESQVLTRGLE